MTRPPFVRRRLERRDDATEALEEAKEVRASRAVRGLSKRLPGPHACSNAGQGLPDYMQICRRSLPALHF